MVCAFAGSIFWTEANLAEPPSSPTTLPIEVMGVEGTVAAVTVELPQTSALQVSSLWLQIQGLEYPDLASVSGESRCMDLTEQSQGFGGRTGAELWGHWRSVRNLEDDRAHRPWFPVRQSKQDRVSLQSNQWNRERLSCVGVQLPGPEW